MTEDSILSTDPLSPSPLRTRPTALLCSALLYSTLCAPLKPPHRFPRPFMPGGNLIAPPPGAPMPAPLTTSSTLLVEASTSSTLLLITPNPGVTQPPQLHLNPCQANLPTFTPQFRPGHVSRPSSLPWTRVDFIQERGWRKMWAQG